MASKTFFVKGVSGNGVTIDIYDSSGNVEVSGGSMTEIASTGVYRYTLTDDDDDYIAVMEDSTSGRKMGIQRVSISTITSDDIADAVWSKSMTSYTSANTFGNQVRGKLLSVAKFLGLK